MTTQEKMNILIANIRSAEDRASRELEVSNDFGHRSHLDFADACRTELNNLNGAN
jgi:hypothetical protein